MNEIELGMRFITGGEPELEEVINLYGEKLLRYATSILCNHHDAEEVVAQVFLSAHRNRGVFNGENLSAWLYKITYNHCMNHLKKRKPLFLSDIETVRDEVVNPFDEAAVSNEVLAALAKLKAEERALLYGRIMDELSYEELSKIFKKSPASLRKQYERTKKKLAGYLISFERSQENEHEYEQI